MKRCPNCHNTYNNDEIKNCPNCNEVLKTTSKFLNFCIENKKGIVVCCFVIVFFLGFSFKSCTGIKVAEYATLQEEKDKLNEEYLAYKEKMKPYEKQQEEDAKAAAEEVRKKSAEEQAKKLEAEKAAQAEAAKKQQAEAARTSANTTTTQNNSEQSSMVITKDYKPTGNEPDWIALISYCEVQMPKVIGYDASISLKDEDTRIVKTGHRYKIETDLLKLKADKSYHKAVFILEFDDGYENYRVDTAEVDGMKFK